jgi:hypothetical protein
MTFSGVNCLRRICLISIFPSRAQYILSHFLDSV